MFLGKSRADLREKSTAKARIAAKDKPKQRQGEIRRGGKWGEVWIRLTGSVGNRVQGPWFLGVVLARLVVVVGYEEVG